MDEAARYNIDRWRALAAADALFTRPALDLDVAAAREMIDPEGLLGAFADKRVLLLASGGGQQSAAFALLGAAVTVIDLAQEQIDRDLAAAKHYGFDIKALQGDMRDLSMLEDEAFDLVWQGYSLNFVPDPLPVFREVARVLSPGGRYYLQCANPFTAGLAPEDWTPSGYPLHHTYEQGACLTYEDADWVYDRDQQSGSALPRVQEFRHTLSTLMNGLLDSGFLLRHLSDSRNISPDPSAEQGTWDHFVSVAPPWFSFWLVYSPEIVARLGNI